MITMLTHVRTSTRSRAAMLVAALMASVVAVVPTPAAAAPGDPIIYGVSGLGTRAVTEINVDQNTATVIGTVATESEAVDLDPATGRLYYYEWETTGTTFGYFDPADGSNTTVRTYAPSNGLRMTRMAFDENGDLFVMDVTDVLYSIDTVTGDLTTIGPVTRLVRNGFRGTGDMAFAADGTLYIAVERRLYEVNRSTLRATQLFRDMANVPGVGFTLWTGLAFCDGQMYASHAEELTGLSGIYTVDPVTGQHTLEFYAGPAMRDLASCQPDITPNTPPVADDDAATTDESQPIAISLSASDADGDALTYTVSTPANGQLTGVAPNLTYTPNPGFFGSDSFTFTANDGTDDSNTATVTITVNDVNVAPVADDQTVTTDQDVAVAVVLSASDADGDALTYSVGTPTNGQLTGTAPNLTYTPNPGYFGTDSFTFTANDGVLTSDPATVTIDVESTFSAPSAPTGLSATAADADVSLSWIAPADDGGVAITDYVVEFAASGAPWQVFADGVSTATTAIVDGLTNYDEYQFRISAVNGVGTGDASATASATPTDGNDPDETFNHPDGPLSARPEWTRVAEDELADVFISNGVLIGTEDPDGSAAAWSTPLGPDIEVTLDATLGDTYNEASVALRLNNTEDYTSSYLLQWVTDGDFTSLGTVVGPTAQIWRMDPGPSFVLLSEVSLPDNGERTLTFAADGSQLSIREGDTVIASVVDSTYATGDYVSIAQANFSNGGSPSQLDNVRFNVLTDPNVAPVASDDSITTDEDVAVAITLDATDADGDALTYTVGTPANGQLTGTAPNLTYTPNPGYFGTDSFTFTANDGTDTSTATVTITVVEVPDPNNAPVASDDSITTDEDVAVAITLDATDADGDALTYTVGTPANGQLTGTAPNLTYTPNPGYFGTDSFTFTANDGTDTSTATVTITVVEVPDPNNAPVASDDSITTDEDIAAAITLDATDADGDPLTYTVGTPANGQLTGVAPNLTYTPNPGYFGTDSFTFTANDGTDTSNTATVTITVVEVPDPNNAPVASDDSITTDEDIAAAITLDATDADGDPLTYTVGTPANGQLTGVAPNLTYTPNPGYFGTDSFTFTANDGTDTSNTATVTITVVEVPDPNNAPVASDDSVTTDEDIAAAITLDATDADGDALTYTVGTPANGQLTGTAPNLTYTPDPGFFGSDSFTFTANDGTDTSNTATVSITVNEVNIAPVANDDSITTDEDIAAAITLSASDADGDALTYTVGTPANGQLTGVAPNLTYTPNPGYFGSDSFTFTANDGTDDSNTATITVTVVEVPDPNNAPVASDDSVTTDEDIAAAITLSASDADGDALTYTVGTPANGQLTGVAPNLTYTPNPGYFGSDSFTFTANDGTDDSNTATITITVVEVPDPNNAPVASDDSVTTDEDIAAAITLDATDADGDALTYTVGTPANGQLTGTAPNLTYTPNPGYFGPDTFTFTANDGTDDSNTATITITVVEVPDPNNAPVASDDSITTDEDIAAAITLDATDADGDALTYTIGTPANGQLTGTAPNLTYTPNPGYFGTDSFTFTANDGTDTSNTATITITVVEVPDPNNAPVASDASITTDEDIAAAITLSASDADGDALTYTVGTPANGQLTGTAPNLTYTPNPGYFGSDSFTFTANDGTDTSNTATITITVNEAASPVVVWSVDPFGQMTSINVDDGTFQQAASASLPSHAIATDPNSDLIFVLEYGAGADELATWDPTTGTTTTIRTYAGGVGFLATQMAFAPDGTLYVIDDAATLHDIDPATGDITTLGAISGLVSGRHNQVGDLAFGADGTAYVATYGVLYTLDIPSRTATPLHSDMFGTPLRLWLGLTFCDGELYGLDVRGGTFRSTVYRIDIATGAITPIVELPTYVTDLACG